MQYGYKNFISSLGVIHSISRPLKLFYNNSAAVSFSRNTWSTSCFKHIDVKFYFVKEKVTIVLIVYDWLWLCKSLVEAFEL